MHRWILGASLTLASACTHVEVDPFWPHADPRRPRNVLLMVTGRYAGRTGLGETILAGGGIGLSADAPSLPGRFTTRATAR